MLTGESRLTICYTCLTTTTILLSIRNILPINYKYATTSLIYKSTAIANTTTTTTITKTTTTTTGCGIPRLTICSTCPNEVLGLHLTVLRLAPWSRGSWAPRSEPGWEREIG